jgi:class 3 adenylate cyclase
LSPVILDFNGTIKDYAGDAVFAFWDHHSKPRTEQALLACKAALKQAQTVRGIRGSLSNSNPAVQDLRIGWGVTTGKVTISHYGSRVADVAIVGDSTNLAFRLSAMANKDFPSEILICSQTAALVRKGLSISDLGFVSIRGRSGREKIFGISLNKRILNYERDRVEDKQG